MSRSATTRATRLALSTALLFLIAAVAPAARAQGYPGGMPGGERGGERGGRPDEGGQNRVGNDVARRFEDMGSLKDALKGVDGLSKAQKDSLKRIESHGKDNLAGYGRAAKKLFDDAKDSGGRPDAAQLRGLQEDARKLRDEHLAAARGVLDTDAQRTRFDANVARIHADDQKRDTEMLRMREQRGGEGRDSGEAPPAR